MVASSVREQSTMIMNNQQVHEAIRKMSNEIISNFPNLDNMVIIGIHTRGVHIAKRIQKNIMEFSGKELPVGTLDINLYRDDWTKLHTYPTVRSTHIPKNLDNADVILVDDVLYTGRTVRAALDALIDFGRPRKVHLVVLVDRGHRELPICAQYVGITIPTEPNQHVNVFLKESDGVDQVLLTQNI